MRTIDTTTDSDGDWLDQALRAEGAEHRAAYVADDGFAARVMARLPEAATLPAWRRPAIAVLWLGAAVAAVLGMPGLIDDTFRGTAALLLGHRIGVADVVALGVLFGAVTCGSLIYAARVD